METEYEAFQLEHSGEAGELARNQKRKLAKYNESQLQIARLKRAVRTWNLGVEEAAERDG